jgi:toxin HigB-1
VGQRQEQPVVRQFRVLDRAACAEAQETAEQVTVRALDVISARRYYAPMIRGFRDRSTERLFLRERVKKFSRQLQRAALRKLALLDAAEALEDLRVPPGNRLEKLSGDREGRHSIRIGDQWRLCFRWSEGDAHDVEITDYH